MYITHIPEEVCDICSKEMYFYISLNLPEDSNHYNNALNSKVWWSGNVLKKGSNHLRTNFLKAISFLKNMSEKIFHERLDYTYLHFIDYKNGGSMDYHTHEHAEDYVFILYLNDCLDGETNFHLGNIVSLTPKKAQISFFESTIPHSGSFSKNKQILVGGLKKFKEIN